MENIEEIPEELPIMDNQETPKTFMFKIENSKIMKSIIETISSIIDETKLTISDLGLTIEAMDPSRICLFNLRFNKNDFDEFENSGKFSIVINMEDLDKILKRASATDNLVFNYTSKTGKLSILMKKEEKSRGRRFSLSELDSEIEKVPLDDLLSENFETYFEIGPEVFIEATKDAEIYSEILNLKCDPEFGLIFSASGVLGDLDFQFEKDDLISANLVSIETGSYSLTFLKKILKISNITEKLEVSVKTDYPLKMKFSLLEGAILFFWLAPRVENDSDFDEEEFSEEFD